MRSAWIASGLAAAMATPAAATVLAAQPNGFTVSNTAEIAAPPAKVWAAMIEPGRWWNGEHSWFGDAKNLRLEAKAGACFCEIARKGQALHMLVSYVKPGEELRLWGSLGPLQTLGAGGGMVLKLEPTEGGTRLTWTYTVGGYMNGGLDTLASPVDQVLAMQLGRLERYVETGLPAQR